MAFASDIPELGCSDVAIQAWRSSLNDDDQAVLALRCFLFDICNQNGGGHGGSALGMAAIGVALYKYIMRYNPSNPEWFDRDRFVLSNGTKSICESTRCDLHNLTKNIGHTAMFLYALHHLTGFDDWTMDEIKGYGSAKTDGYKTMCHAHPEIEDPGIEVTTGPLGQGIANAVGLAIAAKNLGAKYNQKCFDLIQSRIYCMTGDGCLMEGVALEAISLAGNLGLDNLVLIYDNNQVTCDGPLNWINTENINDKMRASGWHVLDVADGCYDVQAIVSALRLAKTLVNKPTFVNIRTVIGVGTKVAGTFKAHHGAFDQDTVKFFKRLAGQDPSVTHQIPSSELAYFRERKGHGEDLERDWKALLQSYSSQFPALAQELSERQIGSYGTTWHEALKELNAEQFQGLATRDVNGNLIERLWKIYPALCGGGADLVNSNKIPYAEADVFHPSVGFSGRYVRHGIREHAMASIANGLAAYNPGTFLPLTATFLMFYLYVSSLLTLCGNFLTSLTLLWEGRTRSSNGCPE